MRSRLLVAAPLALHAGLAAAAFDPPDGKVFRYLIVETRSGGAAERTFTAERDLVFHHAPDGFTADLTLVRVDQGSGGEVGAMFERALGALKGQTIRFRLDHDGTIVRIEDRAAIWARIAGAVARMAPGESEVYGAPLAAMPADRQTAMIASMLAPVIAGKDAEAAPGERPVTVPADSPVGAPFTLVGHEARSRDPDGTLYVAVDAAGHAPLPAATDPLDPASPLTQDARVAMSIRRRIDPVTGLVLETRETSETTLGDGRGMRRSSISTVTTLIAKVS